MRTAIAFVAVLCGAAGTAMPHGRTGQPFSASWQRCETYRDASVCAWIAMAQKGLRACAVRQDFATNAYYTHRLTGTATGNRVHFDRICGDPGPETDSFCAGQAPEGVKNVGWTSYDRTLHVCKGHLVDDPAGCNGPNGSGMERVSASRLPLSDADRGWLASCATSVPRDR
ncbi:hypothetical protein QLH51_03635 [Sphingomonas sp. 2R-10]|uniref:hypothetical protein n=1 Tax=Sphingomonas sp. 2R-10 TaxID=3045148 RepID=UPI000F78809C|nr:hypothetical protein [Sphingomonas sp. 2R-10]MDJ0275893.1 hypothetical protein [Sphingomonas sp. 2R-10]